jgi:predicted CoA-binding protein
MSKSVAIVGASTDRSKYGNKAVRAFKQSGWTVYPVNPTADEVEGLRCYACLADVPDPLDRVCLYVPPKVGREMLPDIVKKAPQELWLSPGSQDEELVEEAEALGLDPIQACSIVNIGLSPAMFPDD